MSHVTKTESPVELKDKAAIVTAAKKLGATVLLNEEALGWANNTHFGEIVLRHPKSKYDVALNKNATGVYGLEADLFGGHVESVYGTNEHPYGRLIAMYGAEVARKVALLRGYRVTQTVDQQSGTITQRVVVG